MSATFGKRKKSDGIDFYPTHPLWTKMLCDRVQFTGDIWEPACGDGAISKVLKTYYAPNLITSTDKYSHGYGRRCDFLTHWYGPVDNVITNPPSFIFDDFLSRALHVATKKVAFLFGSFILTSSQERYRKFWQPNPPSKVIHIVNRMKVFGESSQFTHCWAIWDKKNKTGKTEMEWAHASDLQG